MWVVTVHLIKTAANKGKGCYISIFGSSNNQDWSEFSHSIGNLSIKGCLISSANIIALDPNKLRGGLADYQIDLVLI